MGSTTLELTLLLLLILANGLFSMAEMAVVSSRKARLRQRAMGGSKGAAVALDLAANPNDFLSTVQIGITTIGTLAGAFGGATLAEKLAVYLNQFPLISPHGESAAITLVVLVITYLSLILGELVPKNLALSHPEAIASLIAQPMRALARVGSPIVSLLTLSTRAVMFLIPGKSPNEAPVTEEEIKVLIAQGAEHGTFAEAEQGMVEGVFRLGDRTVSELMTSRMNVIWLNLDDDWAVNERKVLESVYTIFPVARGELDRLMGIVHVKDILGAIRREGQVDLALRLRKPIYFPEATPALKALEMFQSSREHLAFVIDEHGGVEGILTLTDLVQAVVGDLGAAGGKSRPQAILQDDGSWLADGAMPVRDLLDLLGLKEPPSGIRGFHTAAGLVLATLNRIPNEGDRFVIGPWSVVVAALDGKRIDKVLITRAEGEPDENGIA